MNQELTEKDFADFIWLLPRVSYVGEVGLDYSGKKVIPQEQQKVYFSKIIEKCSEMNKLVTVQLRKAEDEAIKIIKRYKPRKIIIHWFTGSELQLQQLIELEQRIFLSHSLYLHIQQDCCCPSVCYLRLQDYIQHHLDLFPTNYR